jgi:beta-lactamase regulating signal transducer with metallopeptidase domain
MIMENLIAYFVEQSLGALIIFALAWIVDYLLLEKLSGHWRSLIWMGFLTLLVVPFQSLSEVFFAKESLPTQVIHVSLSQIEEIKEIVMPQTQWGWNDTLFAAWLIGFCISLLFFFIGPVVKEARLKRRLIGEPIDLKESLYPTVSIDAPVGPFVSGLLSPKIYLPQSLINQWSDSERQAVILHESAHILYKDLWKNLFSRFVTCLFWFYPPVYLACFYLKEAMESQADEFALKQGEQVSKKTLAEVLFKLGTHNFSTEWKFCGINMYKKSHLRRRLEAMKKINLKQKSSVLFPVGVLSIFLATSLFIFNVNSKSGNTRMAVFSNSDADPQGDIATILVEIRDPSGEVIATPALITRFEQESSIVFGDDDNLVYSLELVVKEEGEMARVKGSFFHCQAKGTEQAAMLDAECNDRKNRFEVVQKYNQDITLSGEGYQYVFQVLKGARTKKFLKNIDKARESKELQKPWKIESGYPGEAKEDKIKRKFKIREEASTLLEGPKEHPIFAEFKMNQRDC